MHSPLTILLAATFLGCATDADDVNASFVTTDATIDDAQATDDAQAIDGSDTAAPVTEILPEWLVESAYTDANPDATLVNSRRVYAPDGSVLGTLLTFRHNAENIDAGDGIFRGSSYFSVLAANDSELPLWLVSTSGRLVGLPETGDLVYGWADQVWAVRDADAANILHLADGSTVDAENVGGYDVNDNDALENLSNRIDAEDRFIDRLAACTGNYGTVLSSIWGVTAYSNGSCTATGSGSYQCVELIDRLHKVTVSHSGNANTYNDGNNARKMSMRAFANGAESPKEGAVFVSDDGLYGHVGALSSVGSTSVTITDQNRSSTSATASVTLAGSTLGKLGGLTLATLLVPGWDFGSAIDTTASIYGWSVSNASISSVSTTAVTLNPSSDPYIKSPSGLQLDPTRYKKVKIRMSSKAPDGNVRVYFTTTTYTGWAEVQAESSTVSTSGSYYDVTVDMSGNGYWVYGGRVNQIRVDPCSNGNSTATDLVVIDKVWFEG